MPIYWNSNFGYPERMQKSGRFSRRLLNFGKYGNNGNGKSRTKTKPWQGMMTSTLMKIIHLPSLLLPPQQQQLQQPHLQSNPIPRLMILMHHCYRILLWTSWQAWGSRMTWRRINLRRCGPCWKVSKSWRGVVIASPVSQIFCGNSIPSNFKIAISMSTYILDIYLIIYCSMPASCVT